MHHIITVDKRKFLIQLRNGKRHRPAHIGHHIGRIAERDVTVLIRGRHTGDGHTALKVFQRYLGKSRKTAGYKLHSSFFDIVPVHRIHKAGIDVQPVSHIFQKVGEILLRGVIIGPGQIASFPKLGENSHRFPGSAAEAVPILYHGCRLVGGNHFISILFSP